MLQQESIYNLIPNKKLISNRSVCHISRYPPDIPPTSSTFILNGSSVPGISNANGDYKLPRGGHPLNRNNSTFGLPIGSYAADPKNFHKKGETFKILPPIEKLHQNCQIKKPPIPHDKPIQNLKSDKNYILSNAIDNILMQPKKIRTNSCENIRHKYYGKIPNYLKKFKLNKENEINNSRELRRKMQEEEDAKKKILSDEEVTQLREGLQKRWQYFNNRYGKITHKRVFDNFVLLRK